MRKLFLKAVGLLGAAFLFSSALVFAKDPLATPLDLHSGGTGASDLIDAKENLEIPEVVQTAGISKTDVMSQKAVTDLVASGSGGGIVVTQVIGQSTTNVMSQKASTDNFATKTELASEVLAITSTLNNLPQFTIENQMGQSSNAISQKAVTDAITNVANTIPQITIESTIGNSTTSVMSQKAITDAILTAKSVVDIIYPVGAIFMSVNSVSPEILFPGTVWEIGGAGRLLVGVNENDNDFNIPEKSGGSKAHAHPLSSAGGAAMRKYANQFIQGANTTAGNMPADSNNFLWYTSCNGDNSGYSPNHPGISLYGKTDNISTLPPYITCYMWKRLPPEQN